MKYAACIRIHFSIQCITSCEKDAFSKLENGKKMYKGRNKIMEINVCLFKQLELIHYLSKLQFNIE